MPDDTFALTPPTGPLVGPECHEQGMKVYELNDMEWWAGYDFESCVEAALQQWGGTREEHFDELNQPDQQPCNLDANTVNLSEDEDPNGERASYRTYLRKLIDDKATFPCFFAGIS